jgi:transposase InsO family protein
MIPDGPNQLWVADLSYVAVAVGFVYVAVILDAWSRRVVGYAISRRIDTRLTLAALRTVVEARRPAPGCIHHSDRGGQYAADLYRKASAEFGLQGSMGRRGNPYDNAKAESFMKTLKCEHVYLNEDRNFAEVVERSQRSSIRFTTHADCTWRLAICRQCNLRNDTYCSWSSFPPDISPVRRVHSTLIFRFELCTSSSAKRS